MQNPAAPDLAHTVTRPVHWLATAAAMSGVVALAALLSPGAAKASPDAPKPRAGIVAAPGPAPDPATAVFPLDCGGAKTEVTGRATGDLDGDGAPETVVTARCEAGSGTPPTGVYVLTRAKNAEGAPSRVVATLVDPEDKLGVLDLAVRDGSVSATLLGYSSSDVPRCCPDRRDPAKWQWRGGAFVRSSAAEPRSV
ncbi:hypothetical protein [Streptomyces sp. NPDC050504]|uniref:hypothetical protein n=1 Tax=Streptomyces sp. NPDC050504 TaxID=3365618 RepID=UPI00379AB0FE